jgi:hypothetical protein
MSVPVEAAVISARLFHPRIPTRDLRSVCRSRPSLASTCPPRRVRRRNSRTRDNFRWPGERINRRRRFAARGEIAQPALKSPHATQTDITQVVTTGSWRCRVDSRDGRSSPRDHVTKRFAWPETSRSARRSTSGRRMATATSCSNLIVLQRARHRSTPDSRVDEKPQVHSFKPARRPGYGATMV